MKQKEMSGYELFTQYYVYVFKSRDTTCLVSKMPPKKNSKEDKRTLNGLTMR